MEDIHDRRLVTKHLQKFLDQCCWGKRYIIKRRDYVVKGTSNSRWVIGDLVNGKHFFVMRKHHDMKNESSNHVHGIHETPTKENIIIKMSIYELNIYSDGSPNKFHGTIIL